MFEIYPTPKTHPVLCNPAYVKDHYCAVVNVADTMEMTSEYMEHGIPSFWFPVHELKNWGYIPFYGTLRVVQKFYKKQLPVLIHCHAGQNRSPTVAAAIMQASGYRNIEIDIVLGRRSRFGMLEHNIEYKHVPNDIIEFLKLGIDFPEYSIHGICNVLKTIRYGNSK